MSETKNVILKVSLADDKKSLVVTINNSNEAVLALALRRAAIAVDDLLVHNDLKREADSKSDILIPKSILSKLG